MRTFAVHITAIKIAIETYVTAKYSGGRPGEDEKRRTNNRARSLASPDTGTFGQVRVAPCGCESRRSYRNFIAIEPIEKFRHYSLNVITCSRLVFCLSIVSCVDCSCFARFIRVTRPNLDTVLYTVVSACFIPRRTPANLVSPLLIASNHSQCYYLKKKGRSEIVDSTNENKSQISAEDDGVQNIVEQLKTVLIKLDAQQGCEIAALRVHEAILILSERTEHSN